MKNFALKVRFILKIKSLLIKEKMKEVTNMSVVMGRHSQVCPATDQKKINANVEEKILQYFCIIKGQKISQIF